MKRQLKVKFDNGLELEWKIKDEPVAQKWANAVSKMLETSLPDRVNNFHFIENPKEHYYEVVKEAMKKIKALPTGMPRMPSIKNLDLDYLNSLHEWFAGTQEINSVIGELHMALHNLEAQVKGQGSSQFPNTQIAWQNSFGIPFEDEEYEQFDTAREFGDLFLTYHHIGKDAFSIYFSNDKLDDSVFVPYTHYSPDCVIWFGPSYNMVNQHSAFWEWFDENYEWFKERTGWSPRDPKVATTRYTVGTLLTELDRSNPKKLLTPETKLVSMEFI